MQQLVFCGCQNAVHVPNKHMDFIYHFVRGHVRLGEGEINKAFTSESRWHFLEIIPTCKFKHRFYLVDIRDM